MDTHRRLSHLGDALGWVESAGGSLFPLAPTLFDPNGRILHQVTRNGTGPPPPLEVRGAYLGLSSLVSKARSDGPLCFIPSTRLISSRAVLRDWAGLAGLLAPLVDRGRPLADAGLAFSALTVFLMKQDALYREGEGSQWAPLIRILPRVFTAPLFWSGDDLRAMRGFAIGARAETVIAGLDDEYDLAVRELCVALALEEGWCFGGGHADGDECEESCGWAAFRWARTVVQTRAFSHEEDGERVSALVPLVDLLNHDTVSNEDVVWVAKGLVRPKPFVFAIAVRDLEPGREVFTSYGDIGYSGALTGFGFSTPLRPGEPIDGYLMLPAPDDGCDRERYAELVWNGLTQHANLREGQFPTELLGSAHVLSSPCSTFPLPHSSTSQKGYFGMNLTQLDMALRHAQELVGAVREVHPFGLDRIDQMLTGSSVPYLQRAILQALAKEVTLLKDISSTLNKHSNSIRAQRCAIDPTWSCP